MNMLYCVEERHIAHTDRLIGTVVRNARHNEKPDYRLTCHTGGPVECYTALFPTLEAARQYEAKLWNEYGRG